MATRISRQRPHSFQLLDDTQPCGGPAQSGTTRLLVTPQFHAISGNHRCVAVCAGPCRGWPRQRAACRRPLSALFATPAGVHSRRFYHQVLPAGGKPSLNYFCKNEAAAEASRNFAGIISNHGSSREVLSTKPLRSQACSFFHHGRLTLFLSTAFLRLRSKRKINGKINGKSTAKLMCAACVRCGQSSKQHGRPH